MSQCVEDCSYPKGIKGKGVTSLTKGGQLSFPVFFFPCAFIKSGL
jgi:hypothetical protein